MSKTLALTGWAFDKSSFSDSDNKLLIIDSTKFLFNTQERWLEELKGIVLENSIETIIGFSMGAIMSLKLLEESNFKRVTLLAPTFSFISRGGGCGVSKLSLNLMIKAIKRFPKRVLKEFYKNCGVSNRVDSNYSIDELVNGLEFLRETYISPQNIGRETQLHLVHGESDKIINLECGQEVANTLNGDIEIVSGGHISALNHFNCSNYNL